MSNIHWIENIQNKNYNFYKSEVVNYMYNMLLF